MHFREMCGKGRPLALPQIKWEKEALRNEDARLQLMTTLVEKHIVPEEQLLRLLNLDPAVVNTQLDKEIESKLIRKKAIADKLKAKNIPITPEFAEYLGLGQAGQPGAPSELPMSLGGGDMGGGGGGGMGEMAGMTTAPGGLPQALPEGGAEGGITAGIGAGGDLQGSPAESHLPVGMPVS
jgi:hypothetical protein